MTITRPKQVQKPLRVQGFSLFVHECLSEESPLLGVACIDETLNKEDFRQIEIHKAGFEKCVFSSCHFEKASFIDVIFKSCDLSGSSFRDAYFERCQFLACKCIGVDMSDTRIKQVSFSQTKLSYSYFDRTKISDVLFDQVDFTEASMIEARISRFEACQSIFVKNNFFQTMLSSVDFSPNEFVAPVVSMPPQELKGAILSASQAADLISLWGIIVKNGS